jgi:hypothetical protein
VSRAKREKKGRKDPKARKARKAKPDPLEPLERQDQPAHKDRKVIPAPQVHREILGPWDLQDRLDPPAR